jgi:hypothetical protein
MHFFSAACVCGVHWVMANGVHTAGTVLAKFASTSPCFNADGVVAVAVPAKGLTYLTRPGTCAKATLPINANTNAKQKRIDLIGFVLLKLIFKLAAIDYLIVRAANLGVFDKYPAIKFT